MPGMKRGGPTSSFVTTRRACTSSAGGTRRVADNGSTSRVTRSATQSSPFTRSRSRRRDERDSSERPVRHAARPFTDLVVPVQWATPKRSAGRHAGLGAARQRRATGRPQLQAASAARHLLLRRRGADRPRRRRRGCASDAGPACDARRAARRARCRERQLLAERRLRPGSRQRRIPRRVAGRVLLQNVHVPDWHWFEPAIRRMAGLGRASGLPDPPIATRKYRRHPTCSWSVAELPA